MQRQRQRNRPWAHCEYTYNNYEFLPVNFNTVNDTVNERRDALFFLFFLSCVCDQL